MSEQVKHYAERDIMDMDRAGNYYCRHISAMTAEGLHSKSDIAAELGFRDQRIDALHAEAEALTQKLAALEELHGGELGLPSEGWPTHHKRKMETLRDLHLGRIDRLESEAEALRAENGRLKSACDHNKTCAQTANDLADQLSTELEVARGLLSQLRGMINCTAENDADKIPVWISTKHPVIERIDAFLTATPAPEVPDHTEQHLEMVEQGERQEAVAWYTEDHLTDKSATTWNNDVAERWRAKGWPVGNLYATPHPGPDVRALVEAMNFACKSLCHVTSSDGSGHADIALSVLRMAGVDGEERERLVDGWKASCQWRIDKANRQAQQGGSNDT